MRVRALGADGDMAPCTSLDQMLQGAPAVAQTIRMRTDFLYGEWWEDRELGFRVPAFLEENVREQDVEFLVKYVAAYIAQTEDVTSAEVISSAYSDHELLMYCGVTTVDSEDEVVEVDLSGIL